MLDYAAHQYVTLIVLNNDGFEWKAPAQLPRERIIFTVKIIRISVRGAQYRNDGIGMNNYAHNEGIYDVNLLRFSQNL